MRNTGVPLGRYNMSNIIAFLQKSFQSFTSSIQLDLNETAYELVKTAQRESYVETFSSHADALHGWIGKTYEVDLKEAFELCVRKALKILGVTRARLAFDFTSELFYGASASPYLFNVQGESWNAEFKFATVCLVTRGKQLPLMALPVRVGEGVARPTIELLEYCKTLFRDIRFALFDRGYYCAELIDFLQANKIRYLILVPEKEGTIASYVNQTIELGKFKHEMRYTKDKSTWKPATTIVVCKGIDDFAWIFATNIHLKTRCEYILLYKRRWQIETNYRVEDEARIKSKSTNHLTRYFYFLVSLLFHACWIIHKNLHANIQFKRYLDNIEKILYGKVLQISQM